MISARAADFILPGVTYTPDNPLVLKTEDFQAPALFPAIMLQPQVFFCYVFNSC